jgi:hypothetical protein
MLLVSFGSQIFILGLKIICQRELELERRVGPPVGAVHGFALKEEVRHCWIAPAV